MKDKFLEDKQRVLGWMEKYCYGYKNARTRENILPFIQLKDRYFRQIASELIHEKQLCSSHTKGFWFFPLVSNDPREIEAFKQCQVERKAKALDLLTGVDGCIAWADELLAKARQGQQEMCLGKA